MYSTGGVFVFYSNISQNLLKIWSMHLTFTLETSIFSPFILFHNTMLAVIYCTSFPNNLGETVLCVCVVNPTKNSRELQNCLNEK